MGRHNVSKDTHKKLQCMSKMSHALSYHIIHLCLGNRGYYMAAQAYEFYLHMLKVSLTSERSERVRDTFSTRR